MQTRALRKLNMVLVMLIAARVRARLTSREPHLYSKTLIVTTAKDTPLLKVWLPSLEQKGEYKGDILVIDYDLSPQTVRKLQQHANILLVKCEAVYRCLASDRHRAFYEALKPIWDKYQTIMIIDGNDMEFFKPIRPLFDMAKEKVCYVTETLVNGAWAQYAGPPDSKEVWNYIKNKLIANAGMYVGPAKLIFEIQKHIAENLVYNSYFGADQLSFNAMIYYYKIPSQEVDKKWNFIYQRGIVNIGLVTFIRLIADYAILHNIGQTKH